MKNLITTCKDSQFSVPHLRFMKYLSALVPKCLTAFTLAETLIVIGIIGVVAALTLPNLNHATGDKEKVTKVKKIYSALTDAVDRAQVIYGPSDEWYVGTDGDKALFNERFGKRITEFMKVSKVCGFDDGCWSNAPLLDASGNIIEEHYFDFLQQYDNIYTVSLADGMSVAFKLGNAAIIVDIDGPNKGKTQMGNDIFDFVLPSGDSDNYRKNQLAPHNPGAEALNGNLGDCYSGNYSALWVIENGNLDYLKAVNTNGSYICPNGNVLNWVNQTSCN